MVRQVGAQNNAIVTRYLVSQDPSEGYYSTISAALTDAAAIGGPAVIMIKPGTYAESIYIGASLTNITLQATAQNQNTSLVTIQGPVILEQSAGTCQMSYLNLQGNVGAPSVFFNSASSSSCVINNCFVQTTLNNFPALKVGISDADSILTITNSSIVAPSYYPIEFISDCQMIISGSCYIAGSQAMILQSNDPQTAQITINGFNTELYVSAFTGDNLPVDGVLFDMGYDITTPQDGASISFQDMALNFNNATFNAPISMEGLTGTCSFCSFNTYTQPCITYDDGIAGFPSDVFFNQCTFSTTIASCITGISNGTITADTCYTIDPASAGNYIAPNLFNPGFVGTISTISYTGGNYGIQKGLRIQREPNTNYNRLAGFAVTGPINYNLSGSAIGAYNSICDVNIGASSAASFGYWSSNAVYNGNQWTTETDSTSNGGGYIKVATSGEMELGIINTSGSSPITVANPDVALRLNLFQSEFQPVYGQFTGSYEIRTQAVYQTSSATPYNLFTLTLNANETVTISGTVVAALADQSDACGGNFLATATRTTSGNITLVGAPIININTTSTANFYVAINTTLQVIQLVVVGLASQNYNWSSFITYHKVLSNL